MVSRLLLISVNNLKRHVLILVCIGLVGCSIPHKTIGGKATSPELLQLEHEVHQLINQYRFSKNLPPLTTSEIITRQARIHSRAMAKRKVVFGHNGFAKRVGRISRSLPHRAAAENVAYIRGYSNPARNVVRGWLRKARHRKAIAGRYELTGIGVAKDPQGGYYFTQILWQ